MTSRENSVTEEIVETALTAALEAEDGPNATSAPEAMRAALEAVWPEPTFTSEELHELIGALHLKVGVSAEDIEREAFLSGLAKLEAMRDATN